MWNRLILAAGVAALGACGFSKELPPDAPGPAVFVGFDSAGSTADEKSSMFPIKVKLSAATDHDVTIHYQAEPGTNVDPSDFDLITPESFVIPAGQETTNLFVKIKADTLEEGDEHLDLVLVDPQGANIALGSERHDLTIRARALPRVSFEQADSQAQEPTDSTFNLVLDEASEFPIDATYTVTSTNATSGVDYVLADGMVTFAPGELSKPVTIDVLDDALDEDNESVLVTITTSTNSVVDNLKDKHTHTILDDQVDPPPTVQFAAATSTHAEGAGTVNITVSLSAASGRMISVPYAVDAANSTATGGGTDFTLAPSPLVIMPGSTSGTIAVAIVQDTTDEPNEVVEVDMGTATNATNTGQQDHRLTITDDDQICYGAAPFAVCLDAPPAGALTLPNSINTSPGGSALCAGNQPTGWTSAPQSQPSACFILRDTIAVTGAVTVQGNRPLVLLGATGITVSGTLDASSSNAAGSTGAASPSTDCDAFGQNPNGNSSGGGGGAGGTFMTVGGNGGTGDGGSNVQAGTAAAAETAPVPKLRAGCNGQRGGNGSTGGSNASGAAGRGGGSVYLVTGGTLTLAATAVINVSGSAGSGGGNFSGGSGAGSGGMAKLYAATLSATAGAVVMANGGGGASGGDSGGGSTGSDPNPATPQTPANGGSGGGAAGGDGWAGATAAKKGGDGGNSKGGGGGGGGGGYVQSNLALTNVTVSAGVVQIP